MRHPTGMSASAEPAWQVPRKAKRCDFDPATASIWDIWIR
jgi:hypothetical protein